jgi:hypothetical protein
MNIGVIDEHAAVSESPIFHDSPVQDDLPVVSLSFMYVLTLV